MVTIQFYSTLTQLKHNIYKFFTSTFNLLSLHISNIYFVNIHIVYVRYKKNNNNCDILFNK